MSDVEVAAINTLSMTGSLAIVMLPSTLLNATTKSNATARCGIVSLTILADSISVKKYSTNGMTSRNVTPLSLLSAHAAKARTELQ